MTWDGGRGYSYSGGGNYSRAISGGTVSGQASASGSERESYGYNAEYRLSADGASGLLGGSGSASGTGGWATSYSGSGSYSRLDQNGPLTLNGTAEEDGHKKWGYRYSSKGALGLDGVWRHTGDGSGSGDGHADFSYSASGSAASAGGSTTTVDPSYQNDFTASTSSTSWTRANSAHESGNTETLSAETRQWVLADGQWRQSYGSTSGRGSSDADYGYSDSDISSYTAETQRLNTHYTYSSSREISNDITLGFHSNYSRATETVPGVNGALVTTGSASGSSSGSGSANQRDANSYSSHETESASGYGHTYDSAATASTTSHDLYDYHDNWTETLRADGTKSAAFQSSNDTRGQFRANSESLWNRTEWSECSGSTITNTSSGNSASDHPSTYARVLDYGGFAPQRYTSLQPGYLSGGMWLSAGFGPPSFQMEGYYAGPSGSSSGGATTGSTNNTTGNPNSSTQNAGGDTTQVTPQTNSLSWGSVANFVPLASVSPVIGTMLAQAVPGSDLQQSAEGQPIQGVFAPPTGSPADQPDDIPGMAANPGRPTLASAQPVQAPATVFGPGAEVEDQPAAVDWRPAGIEEAGTQGAAMPRLWETDAAGQITRIVWADPDGAGPEEAPETLYGYDAAGHLVQMTLPDAATREWTYDAATGKPTSYTDELGRVTRYEYDADGNLALVRQVVGEVDAVANGQSDDAVTAFSYTAAPAGSEGPDANLVASITDALGRRTEFAYNEQGRVVAITYAAGTADEATVAFEYDATGNVVAEIDALGRRAEYGRDADGRVVRKTLPDPDGAGPLASPVYTYQYDASGRVVREVDPLGQATDYAYDGLGQLVTMTRPDHDGDGQATVTTMRYTADGQLASLIDPLGRVTSYGHDSLGRRASVLQADPDAARPLVRPETRTEYDPLGRMSRVIDPLGGVTQYAYEDHGRRVLVTQPDPDGAGPLAAPVTVSQYDAAGNLLSETDPLGRVTSYSYDALGRLASVTQPDPDGAGPQLAPVTRYAYDKVGNLVSVTDPLGQTTQYVYDSRDRLVEVILPDPDGEDGPAASPVIHRSYDAAGQLLSETDAEGNTTSYQYDALGRRTREIGPDPDGPGPRSAPVTAYSYDAVGRLLSVTDPLGHVTQYAYNSLGQCVAITDAAGGLTTFTYDEVGNQLSLTDPVGNTTAWTYDALNRVTAETNELGFTRYFSYDAMGNLTRRVDRNGRVRQFAYDALGRVTTETWYDSVADADVGQNARNAIQYSYDAAGRLLSESDAFSSYSYVYDALDRVTSETVANPGAAVVVFTTTYDRPDDLRASFSATIDGVADFLRTYQYDSLGRMTHIGQAAQSGGNAVASIGIDLRYDSAGRLAALDRYLDTNLVVTSTWQYDPQGSLTALTHAQGQNVLAAYTWSYDSAGRLTDATSPDGAVHYSYDPTDQLTGADYSGSQQSDETYSWDANGNRANTGWVVGPNNQLLSDGTYWYSYDAEGNRTARYVWTDADSDGQVDPTERANITEYVWDHRNRLTSVRERANDAGALTKAIDYLYDTHNRWIGRTADLDGAGDELADTIRFTYDGNQIVLQSDASGALARRNLWGPAVDQILAEEDVAIPSAVGEVFWPLTDQIGTARDVAKYDPGTATTQIVVHRVLDSFGRLISETGAGSGEILIGFTGRPFDTATGLQYNLNRWFDPVVASWLSADPIGFTGLDANTYRYVNNTATTETDPSGLVWAETKAFCHAFFVTGPRNLLVGAGTAIREAAYYARDVGAVGIDAAATAAGHPLGFKEWSQVGQSNQPNNPDFWWNSTTNAGRVGLAGLSAGGSEVVMGTYNYCQTGDDEAFQQHMGGLAALNLTAAAAIRIRGANALRPRDPNAPTNVSRWGRPGLETGDWVMNGSKNPWNYFWSGKWQPGLGNQFAPYNSGQQFVVPSSTLQWPGGFFGLPKGCLGQRIYVGPGFPLE